MTASDTAYRALSASMLPGVVVARVTELPRGAIRQPGVTTATWPEEVPVAVLVPDPRYRRHVFLVSATWEGDAAPIPELLTVTGLAGFYTVVVLARLLRDGYRLREVGAAVSLVDRPHGWGVLLALLPPGFIDRVRGLFNVHPGVQPRDNILEDLLR